MNELVDLRQEVLALGLEDDIPLPEIAGDLRTRAGTLDLAALGDVLVALVREGRIQVLGGYWSEAPKPLDLATAETLLKAEEQYEFNSPADQRMRVYYVNVDNLRG